MKDEVIKKLRAETISRFGSWTAHNIYLAGNLYTMDARVVGDEVKLRRIFQIVSDVIGRPLHAIRILDLACLEGLYAVEFARQGAEVLAIEGREVNIAKARFAKDVLDLKTLTLVRDDVRNFSEGKYGSFDVILCLGLLYHLDVPDVFRFLEAVSQACDRILVIDTHISLTVQKSYSHDEKLYWGRTGIEHSPGASKEEKLKNLWMSLDKAQAFIFTRPSLLNALAATGFTTVFECHIPPEVDKPTDRVTLLAIKGERGNLLSAPLINTVSYERWPEPVPGRQSSTIPTYIKVMAKLVPRRMKETLKRYLLNES